MTDTPHVIDYPTARDGRVECSPDGWVRHAARLVAEGARLVVLDSYPDGPPWDDDVSELDEVTDTWAFVPWPGVRFHLPIEE
jgi:hypothetical protein